MPWIILLSPINILIYFIIVQPNWFCALANIPFYYDIIEILLLHKAEKFYENDLYIILYVLFESDYICLLFL